MKKATLITGAGSGLGKEFALLYASKGNSVVLVDINGEALVSVKEEIQKKGRNVVDEKEMLLIKGWDAEAELIIHSSWVKMFRDKFVGVRKDNVQSSKNKK